MKHTRPTGRPSKAVDALLLLGMLLPIAAGIALKVLLVPASEGIEITGAYIFFTLPLPLGGLPITETQVNSWLVMLSLLFLCLYLTRGLSEKAQTKRQHVAEWIVEQTEGLVTSNMGEYFAGFAPFIGAMLALSAFSSLRAVGIFAPAVAHGIVPAYLGHQCHRRLGDSGLYTDYLLQDEVRPGSLSQELCRTGGVPHTAQCHQ